MLVGWSVATAATATAAAAAAAAVMLLLCGVVVVVIVVDIAGIVKVVEFWSIAMWEW